MPSYKVIFTAKFEGYIDADDAEEAMHEVDIPESDSTKYVNNSMDVLRVEKVQNEGTLPLPPRKKPWSGWFISSIDFERRGSDMIQLSAVLKLAHEPNPWIIDDNSYIKDQKCIEEAIQLPFDVDEDREICISNYGGAGNDQQSILIGVSSELEADGEIHDVVHELQVEIDCKTGAFKEDSLHGWESSYEGDNVY